MEDFVRQSILYDFYGPLLKGNQKLVLEYRIIDDLSFNEIGEELGLTRQAAFDLYNRAFKKLEDFDEKIKLSTKYKKIEEFALEIENLSDDKEIKSLSKKIINITNNGGKTWQ